MSVSGLETCRLDFLVGLLYGDEVFFIRTLLEQMGLGFSFRLAPAWTP